MNKNPIWEASKDIVRLIVLAIPGLIIGYVTDLPETQVTVITLLALRAVDSYIHNNPKIKPRGLVPFN